MIPTPTREAPAPPPMESLEQRFRRLAAEWEHATSVLSSMDAAANHPAYQEIVSLGEPVLPHMLRDLQQNQTHWFIALHAITGASPVPAAAAGNIPQMTEAWLNWAKNRGYRW